MLEITIKGLPREGKSRTAGIIEEYWFDHGRKVRIIEGYKPGKSIEIDENLDVLIKIIQ